jgi:hypothetical protein
MAKLIRKFTDLVQNPSFKAGLLALAILSKKPAAVLGAFGVIGVDAIGGLATSKRPISEKENSALARIRILNARIEAKLAGAKKVEYDLLSKKNAIENKNVEELKKKFDLERIGLNAALNSATDEETKLRLKAQLAILDNNEALAKKLLAEMEGTKATEILTTQFYALSEAAKQLLLSFGVDPSQIGPGGTIKGGVGGRSNIANLANTSINNPAFASSVAGMDLGLALGFTPGSRTSSAAPTEVIVTVNTAAGGDRLSQAIAESIQIATKNGYSTVPAGQGF